MCYFVYGAINDSVNIRDYELAICQSEYRFNPGTKQDLEACIDGKIRGYHVTTRDQCDCDFPIGMHNKFAKELIGLSNLVYKFRDIRNIEHIYLSKIWANEKNKKEVTVHIDDIPDLASYFADMEEDCLYCIELYERYY